tara:strand:+ start:25020 stop:26603 length:1584 start_codon:yes stop_codon:yes gene_type:complete
LNFGSRLRLENFLHKITAVNTSNKSLKLLSSFVVIAGLMTGAAIWVFGDEGNLNSPAATDPAEPTLSIDSSPVQEDPAAEVLSYADMLEGSTPSVVGVITTEVTSVSPRGPQSLQDLFRQFHGLPPEEGASSPESEGEGDQRRQLSGMGSGVIVSPEGYVLTNNHVVRVGRSNEIADEILVQLADGREFEAELIGTDEGTDVAILKIDSDEPFPALTFADSDQLRVGDVCFAIGNPLGVGMTVTRGIVSAMERRIGILGAGYEDFIQTDAAINMGNSGGALIDARGRLIGINTAILSRTGGNIGIGFAIPANMARYVMDSLIQNGEVSRGFMGVGIGDISRELAEAWGLPSTNGALIRHVEKGGAADDAGLLHQDVIIAVNGEEIDSASELRLEISQIAPGEVVHLTMIRDGEEISKAVTLGSLSDRMRGKGAKPEIKSPIEGLKFRPLSDELREKFSIPSTVNGVVISEISPISPENQQFRPGMVILEVNRVPVSSVEEISSRMKEGVNSFYVWYDNIYNFLTYRR